MKLLQIRTRTVLIPSGSLLNAIPKLPNAVLKEENRQALVVSMLEEKTWLSYRTLPARYNAKNPPYAGQTLELLKTLCSRVSDEDAMYGYRCLANAVDKALIASYGSKPIDYPDVGADRGYPHNPQIFDHGVGYHFYQNYLHVCWLRPVVDMKEMSVTTFIEFIDRQLGSHEVVGVPIRRLSPNLAIADFLSVENVYYLEKQLCSTSK